MSGARPGRALRIGLTGPIGCGKSTVAGWLAEAGAAVVDADAIARAVTEPGEPALEAVLGRFGDRYRLVGGGLDRAALGRLVFSDSVALRELEAIIHPAVRPRLVAAVASAETRGARVVVIEAIKLVEGGYAAECDEVWLVRCSPGAQRARLRGRGMSEADLEQRISAQADPEGRLGAAATRVIDTTDPPEIVRRRIEGALREALGRPPTSRPEASSSESRTARSRRSSS